MGTGVDGVHVLSGALVGLLFRCCCACHTGLGASCMSRAEQLSSEQYFELYQKRNPAFRLVIFVEMRNVERA